jgi:hypothetical protein
VSHLKFCQSKIGNCIRFSWKRSRIKSSLIFLHRSHRHSRASPSSSANRQSDLAFAPPFAQRNAIVSHIDCVARWVLSFIFTCIIVHPGNFVLALSDLSWNNR